MNARPLRAALGLSFLFVVLLLTGGPIAPASAESLSLPFEAPPPSRATFPSQAYQIGGNSLDVATGDFNGDGVRDVAVANRGVLDRGGYAGGDVSVLLGYGDGTLAPQIHIGTPHAPQSVVAADFNRDGKDDL